MTADAHPPTDRRVGSALFALFALLVAVYLATGAGRFRIIDEVSLFAVTESVAKRAAVDTNAIAWTQWVNSPGEVLGAFGPEGDVFSKKGPAPALLAVPFYLIGWLSGLLPVAGLRLSMLQTAFWANAAVTALTAVLVSRMALALAYRLRAALAAGLLFGLGTIAWPYATHFFGEPLSMLALLAAIYALVRLRQTLHLRPAAWAGVAAGVMVATSAAQAVLLAPLGLYLVYAAWTGPAQPPLRTVAAAGGASEAQPSAWTRLRRVLASVVLFGIPLAGAAGALLAYNYGRFGALLSTGYHFEAGEGFTANWLLGLWGLVFSPYRGLFWYTPLALASVIAWPGFLRRHRAEGWLLLAITVILISLFGKWWMWWGGFAWGPRFLAPLSPLFVLVLLPWLADGPRRLWARGALGVLVAVSVLVQLLAVSANYVNYEIALRALYPTDWADPLKYGPPALFNPAHSPVLGQVRLLWENAAANLDLGWLQSGRIAWEVPVAALVTGLLAGGVGWLACRRRAGWAQGVAALALAAAAATALLSAQAYATRDEYVGAPGYTAALAEIVQRAGSKDGLVTIAPYHYQAPMAVYRGRLPIYGYAPEPTPLHSETESVLRRGLAQHPRLWLVTVGQAPADPANGVEVWLARQAFVAEDRWLEDARLVAFVTARRLAPLAVRARLGNQVRLLTARVSSETARPGGTLAVELTWQADAPVGELRGFVQLLALDGRLVAGQDGVPGAGYLPSTGWQPATPVYDRRGLLLPADLPPGTYRLIAGLYDVANGTRLPVFGTDGGVLGDAVALGTVAIE